MKAEVSRRGLLGGGAALFASVAMIGGTGPVVVAKDYASRGEALDELDRLAVVSGMRLERVRGSRAGAEDLVSRFLAALQQHRATREDVRRRFSLPRGADPGPPPEAVEGDLVGLRQALDDLMVAYAESLPVFADASVVSRLAVDMVEVSRLRTVIDLWITAEES